MGFAIPGPCHGQLQLLEHAKTLQNKSKGNSCISNSQSEASADCSPPTSTIVRLTRLRCNPNGTDIITSCCSLMHMHISMADHTNHSPQLQLIIQSPPIQFYLPVDVSLLLYRYSQPAGMTGQTPQSTMLYKPHLCL